MIFTEKEFILKDGRKALLRSPKEEDAEIMLKFITRASGETDFLMRYPEEWESYTIEREQTILRASSESPDNLMITCFLGRKIAGNCSITFRTGMKDRHRASVGIALLRDYWNLGIGTKMFQELIGIAKERGDVRQIELDFVEGNTRARALYEKMGFRITGVKPDAIRLKDGTFVNEYMMLKRL